MTLKFFGSVRKLNYRKKQSTGQNVEAPDAITVEVWEQGMINSYDVLFGKFFIVFKNTHFSYSVIYSDGVIEFLFRDHLVQTVSYGHEVLSILSY
jgi:hypothetical protein